MPAIDNKWKRPLYLYSRPRRHPRACPGDPWLPGPLDSRLRGNDEPNGQSGFNVTTNHQSRAPCAWIFSPAFWAQSHHHREKANTKSGQPLRCKVLCEPVCRLTDQPSRWSAARTRSGLACRSLAHANARAMVNDSGLASDNSRRSARIRNARASALAQACSCVAP